MTFRFARLAALAGLGLLATASVAGANTRVGVLDCSVAGGTGQIIVGSRAMDCWFKPSDGGKPERYTGRITKIGLNVGVVQAGRLGWGVFAPSKVGAGALSGTYVGAGVDASIVVGGGGNALLGGFRNSVMLQPFSLEGQTGLNFAGGVAGLSLEWRKR